MPDSYISRPDLSAAKSTERNQAYFPPVISEITPTFNAPEISVYVYNVSRLEFNESRPPNHPHMLIRACPAGEEYIHTGTIVHPFPQKDYDQNGNMRIDYVDGFKEATVMLSPQNPGRDQNWTSPDALNVGGNLNDFGVFWSKHNPPLAVELQAARHRMERTYTAELKELAKIEAKNPANAAERANDISHAAANYFGESTSWHRSDLRPANENRGKVECGVCAEPIQANAKICIHCGAPTDAKKQEAWLEAKTAPAGKRSAA